MFVYKGNTCLSMLTSPSFIFPAVANKWIHEKGNEGFYEMHEADLAAYLDYHGQD